jgi:hypothetical protein
MQPNRSLSVSGPAGFSAHVSSVAEQAAAAYEHGRVTFMLKAIATETGGDVLRRCRALAKNERTDDLLTFDDFHRVVSNFPISLSASRLVNHAISGTKKKTSYDYSVHADPMSTIPELFKNFRVVPFVSAWKLYYGEQGVNTVCGVVFPRRGFQNGMIVHNHRQLGIDDESPVIANIEPDTKTRLYVQSFRGLLNQLMKSGWKAELVYA